MTELLQRLFRLMGGPGVKRFTDVDGRKYMVIITFDHDDD